MRRHRRANLNKAALMRQPQQSSLIKARLPQCGCLNWSIFRRLSQWGCFNEGRQIWWGCLNLLALVTQWGRLMTEMQWSCHNGLKLFLISILSNLHISYVFLWKITLILRNPQKTVKFAWGTKHLFSHVCVGWWKTTFDGRWPIMEDNC